ncbi:hypothetical protein ACOME3_010012 [Neoechinorhynchus agilis]
MGKMIPYDDDIDIIADLRDRNTFNTKCKPELEKRGRFVKETLNPHQTHIKAKIHFKNLKFPRSMFFPVKRQIFEGIMVNVPNKAINFVKERYGKNWNVELSCQKRSGHNCVA